MSTPDTTGRSRTVRKLDTALAEARQLAPLMADPLLNAVRVERLRASVTRCLWFFLCCGLGYTTTGVHDFLATGYTPAAPAWWAAWLVEPAFAGILVTLLRWEAEMLARGLEVNASAVRRLKRLLLVATTVMNVVPTIHPPEGHGINAGNVFVHLVIPLIVFFLAEVMPVVQQTCTTAKTRAMTLPTDPTPADATPVDAASLDQDQADDKPAPEPAPPAPVEPSGPQSPTPAQAPVLPAARVKLPPAILDRLSTALADAREQGRAPGVGDVQRVVQVSDALAARILADLTPTNGHALT